jgi:hypothetical protein
VGTNFRGGCALCRCLGDPVHSQAAALKKLWLLAYRNAQVQAFAAGYLAIAACFALALLMVPLMRKAVPPGAPSPAAHCSRRRMLRIPPWGQTEKRLGRMFSALPYKPYRRLKFYSDIPFSGGSEPQYVAGRVEDSDGTVELELYRSVKRCSVKRYDA